MSDDEFEELKKRLDMLNERVYAKLDAMQPRMEAWERENKTAIRLWILAGLIWCLWWMQ